MWGFPKNPDVISVGTNSYSITISSKRYNPYFGSRTHNARFRHFLSSFLIDLTFPVPKSKASNSAGGLPVLLNSSPDSLKWPLMWLGTNWIFIPARSGRSAGGILAEGSKRLLSSSISGSLQSDFPPKFKFLQ